MQILLWLVFAVFVIPLAITSAARSPFARAYAKTEAARAITRELGLIAVIRDVDLDPPKLSLVAHGITIEHPEHGRLIEAESLRIRPSWYALMRGRIDLNIIHVEQATVYLTVRDGRVLNFPDIDMGGDERTDDEEIDLPINQFAVRDGRLVVDAAPEASGELSHIDITLDATAGDAASVHVEASDGHLTHRAGTDTLDRLEVALSLRRDRLEVETIELATPEAQVALRNATVDFPLGEGSYVGELDAALDLSQLGRWPLGPGLPVFEGRVAVQAGFSGQGEAVSGNAKVFLDDVAIDGFGVTKHGELSVNGDRDGVNFEGFVKAIENGGALDLQGRLAFSEGFPLRAKAQARNVEFAKLMKQLGVSPDAIVQWLISGRFELRGTTVPLALSGPMTFDTSAFQITRDAWHARPKRHLFGFERAHLDGRVRVTGKGIFLENVAAKLPRSTVDVAQVVLGFDNVLRVRAKAVTHDLADTPRLLDFELGGKGSFDVEVDGTFTDVSVRGKMAYKRFAFGTFPFGDVQANYRLEKNSYAVRFTDFVARKQDSRYGTDSLFMDFSDDRISIGTDLRIDRLTLADFYDIFHYTGDERFQSYQGAVGGTARVSYTSGFPEDGEAGTMHADIEVDVPSADLDGYAFTDGRFEGSWHWFNHRAGYRGGELQIDRFSLRKGDGTVSLSGKMAAEGELDLVVLGDRIAVRDTEGLREALPKLGGTYGVTGSVKGNASKPRANLDLIGTGLHLQGQALGGSRAYVRLTDKQDPWIKAARAWDPEAPPEDEPCAHGRMGLARGKWAPDPALRTSDGPVAALDQPMAWVVCGTALDGQVEVDVAVGRTKVMPLRGRYRLNKLTFGRFLPTSRGAPPLSGHVTGDLWLTAGSAKRPETLEGKLHLSELRAGQLDVELRNSGPVAIAMQRGQLRVDSANFIGPDSQLYITGGGSVKRGLDLTFDGNVDLGLAASLSSTISAAMGRVDLRFKVSGPWARPSIHGYAAIHNGALRSDAFAAPIDGVNGTITFTDRRVLLEDFRAEVAGGRLAWRGSAGLDGRSIGNYRLEIGAKDLHLSPQEDMDLGFGATAELSWKRGDRLPKLQGLLRLQKLRYAREVKVGRSIEDMVRKERAEVENYDPEEDILALDLRVVESEPLHVVNNLIDARLTLDKEKRPFRIVGTDQRFGILGSMKVKRGTLRYRNTAFDIREGAFHFNDDKRINPVFDIRATAKVQRNSGLGQNGWAIGMHAFGNRDEFQFDLSSDPYLAKDDIALLLTMGMTHAELAQMETGDLTGTAALEALATVTGVEREVRKAIPTIDEVGVQSAYSNRSARSEPQVYIGKRVADQVRVSAATGVGESRDFSTGVELQVSDQTSVAAKYNNQNSSGTTDLGDMGVDLKWRLEFD